MRETVEAERDVLSSGLSAPATVSGGYPAQEYITDGIIHGFLASLVAFKDGCPE